nr:heme lyase CcmF/NrfE family subunit [Rickettsia prowazekii]
MSKIGNFLLLTTMCLSGILTLLIIPWLDYLIKKNHRNNICLKFFPWIPCTSQVMTQAITFYASSLCSIFAFCTLVYAFITSDFSVQNVFLHSSTLKPLIYKISGSWSSHEGSMLLWFCLLQIVSCCYIFCLEDKMLKFSSIIILSAIQLLFSSFIYFTSNPFHMFSFVPKEGLGLNPMLQDIALSIHPPLLYLGYVSYAVPFTIVCAIFLIAVISRLDNNLPGYFTGYKITQLSDRITSIRLLKIFAGCGILFTTIGISLGSWWAYRELNWGGLWFFDPVENISLFPWLSGIMLHHSIIVTTKTNRMQHWTIILSIITFLLVIFSTFLVRSGFINSIHAFAFSSERWIYLLVILCIIGIGGLYVIIRLNNCSIEKTIYNTFNWNTHSNCNMTIKEKAILIGNIFFLFSLIILICATLYPTIYALFNDKPIIINEEFFIKNFIIFVIPILCTIGLFTTNSSIKKHIIMLMLSLIITYFILLNIKFSVISILTIMTSIFLMLHNVHYLLVKTNYFRNSLKASSTSMILGHFGVALIAFSITMNSLLQSEMDFIGEVGTSKTFNAFKVTLQNIKFAQGKNYYRQIAEFWLEDHKNNITILKPENRFYIIEQKLSQESDIHSYLLYDLYAVLSNIDGKIIHAKIYYKPMMSFIWIGVILTTAGFVIALIRKNSY